MVVKKKKGQPIMKLSNILRISSVAVFLAACNVEPVPINYGSENCNYCEMTIVDPRFGSELVTTKGKVYTFDSIECLVDFLNKNMPESEQARYVLVTPYLRPQNLVKASELWYLHSKAYPSPMGKYLTAFETRDEIIAEQKEHGGTVYTWEELLKGFDNLNF